MKKVYHVVIREYDEADAEACAAEDWERVDGMVLKLLY